MITIKSNEQIALMRAANIIVRDALKLAEDNIKIGVTTKQIDKLLYDYITKCKARPTFLGYGGFPATVCASVNEQVIHGIPNSRYLEEGDIVSIDVGAVLDGWQGDAARTFAVGKITPINQKLIDVTRESFFKGVATLREGARLGDLGAAIQNHAESNGFYVIKKYVGHGIGTEMHEDPAVPNYGRAGHGLRLKAGMTLAIEPMIAIGTDDIEVLSDNWTVVTKDGQCAAHYENTVLITDDGCEILSL